MEMEREESEEATLPKRSSRSARGAGREQRRVTLQRRRRQPAADKTKLMHGSRRINPGRAKVYPRRMTTSTVRGVRRKDSERVSVRENE